MKYKHHQIEYEIEDEWLVEAGAEHFTPSRDCYRPQSVSPTRGEVFSVSIESVEPLIERARGCGIFCDDRGTGESAKQRVVRILQWFAADCEVEPVKVVKSKDPKYEYRLVEGCHRFHCANAMRFKSVPATLGFEF
ncbi:MAG: hypothetical protein ACLQDF_08660 [Desulfomonilia bacterium]